MKRDTFRVVSVTIVLIIYNLSFLLNIFQYSFIGSVSADSTPEKVNIIPILVEKEIYQKDNIKANLERYANSYIQQKVDNSKALLMPINIDNYKAKDIYGILENLYFKGQKDYPSNMKGVILVGDIPLPVVNNNNYIYPSVFPYTDFEDRKFIYNNESGYFDFTGKKDATPDVWHGVINFKSEGEYNDYFSKLRNYASNPKDYVNKKFWYEDFIHMKEVFNENNLSQYINKFLFLEDIAYNRYHKLMFSFFSSDIQNSISKKIDQFSDGMGNLEEKSNNMLKSKSLKSTSDKFFNKINEFTSKFMQGEDYNSGGGNNKKMPTLSIKKSLQNFLRPYSNLFSPEYRSNLLSNVDVPDRWDIDEGNNWHKDDVDNHTEKISMMDESIKDVLLEYNKSLEKSLDKKVDKEGYHMKIPINYKYEKDGYNKNISGVGTYYVNPVYKNFYFGKYAKNINKAKEFNIFEGKYNDISNLTGMLNENISNKRSSLGSSKGLFSTQIQANRGYNTSIAKKDGKRFKNNRCANNENAVQWSRRLYGGASPINLDTKGSSKLKLKEFNRDNAWDPSVKGRTKSYENGNLGGSVKDFGGSVEVKNKKDFANNYKGYKKYSSLIKTSRTKVVSRGRGTRGGLKNTSKDYLTYCKAGDKSNIPYSKVDFFKNYNNGDIEPGKKINMNINGSNVLSNAHRICIKKGDTSKGGNTSKGGTASSSTSNSSNGSKCEKFGYTKISRYYYTLVDTRIKNKSPTKEQVEDMNFGTKDRPIISNRNITFKGIGGDKVKLEYPNIFEVNVYNKIGDSNYSLKSKEKIKSQIKNYLRNKVKEYNKKLKKQLNNSDSYYSKYPNAYDAVDKVDDLATPNRNYNLLNKDFFINSIGKEAIDVAANYLYYLNLPQSNKNINGNKIKENISSIQENFQLNKKISYSINKYLSSDTSYENSFDKAKTPLYNTGGYEVGFINSNGSDAITTSEVPSKVERIKQQQTKFESDKLGNKSDSADSKSRCKMVVPIFERPAGIQCWINQELTNSDYWNVKKDYSCSMGPTVGEDKVSEKIKEKNEKIDQGVNYISKKLGIKEKNKKIKENATDAELEKIKEIEKNFKLDVLPRSSIYLNQNIAPDRSYSLEINSSKDIGEVNITFSAVGSSCKDGRVLIEGNSICENNNSGGFETSVYPTVGENQFDFRYTGKKSGQILLTYEVCKNGACYNFTKLVNVIHGKPDKIEFISPTNKILKGGKLPFKLNMLDKFGNYIGTMVEQYKVSTEYGKIDFKDNKAKEISFNNFSRANFILDTSSLDKVVPDEAINSDIKISPVGAFKGRGLPKKTKNIEIVEGSAKILSGSSKVNNISYDLSPKTHFYKKDKYGITQIQKDELLSYEIKLTSKNGQPLSSPVSIKTSKGLMKPGEITTKNITINDKGETKYHKQEKFSKRENFIIKNGKLKFYLKPTMDVGNEKLIIDIPGLKKKTINIEVNPSDAVKTEIVVNNNNYTIGDTIKGKVYIKDIFGNLVQGNESVTIETIGNINFEGGGKTKSLNLNVSDGVGNFKINTESPGGRAYIISKLNDVKFDKQYPDYEKINIENSFLSPFANGDESLNVMYMNLFGSDWGNRSGYFSNRKNFAQRIMQNSSKTLGITTQLVDPESIKKASTIINTGLNIDNLGKNNTTINFSGSSLYFNMKDVGRLNVKDDISNFDLSLQDSFNGKIAGNEIIYVPEKTDSKITSNTLENRNIVVNDKNIIDFNKGNKKDGVSISINGTKKGITKWSVKYGNKLVGSLFISTNMDINSLRDNIELKSGYSMRSGYTSGSTNSSKGIMIYKNGTNFKNNTTNFDSIEDSTNTDKNIGFKGDFKNITLFGNGNTLGESTKNFASEFVYNIGDPLLTRISKNEQVSGTNFDGGMGKKVFSEAQESIMEVKELDFNKDGLQDLIVVYNNGTIRLLKNYGGNEPFVDMGDLMVVSDGIKKVFVGDTNGDNFEDIMIRTEKDNFRVYKNENGMFDVNGTPICLNVYKGPNSLKGVSQVFVEDMNNDGKVDIITNDKNQDIKIFYGGSGGDGHYYVSKDKYRCDKNWKDRNKENLVKDYSLKISNRNVYDNSLLHWPGLEASDGGGHGSNLSSTKNVKGSPSPSEFSKMMSESAASVQKYQNLPSNFVPKYYSDNKENEDFAKMSYLDDEDPVKMKKNFEKLSGTGSKLDKGDVVKITHTIKAKKDTKLTYIDDLRGPWKILKNKDGSILGFDEGNLEGNYVIKWEGVSPYNFMIDGLKLKGGKEYTFSYNVKYNGTSLVKIDIVDGEDNNFENIKAYPKNACIGGYDFFKSTPHSGYNHNYEYKFVDLKEKNTKYNKDQQKKTRSKYKKYQNALGEKGGSLGNIVSQVVGNEDWAEGMFSTNASIDGSSLSVNTNVLGGNLDKTAGDLKKFMKNACGGFRVGGGSGSSPAPTNMAFLSPGEYNAFGCSLGEDKGLPVFFFPGTVYTPGGPVPIPNGLKGSGDGFYWAGGGAYNSQIRMYVSPTLTKSVGVAICFGSYQAGMQAPPQPAGSISGNCIVTAGTGGGGGSGDGSDDGDSDDENAIKDWQDDIGKMGQCKNQDFDGKTGTPLDMVYPSGPDGGSGNTPISREFAVNDKPVAQFSQSFIGNSSTSLKGGEKLGLSIESPSVNGLMKCLVQGWMDKQIRYMLNNLTNMTFYVKFPDISGVVEDGKKIMGASDDINLNELMKGVKSSNGNNKTKEKSSLSIPDRQAYKDLSKSVSNPFERVETYFKDINLINISTKDINIQVPFITQEELEQQLQSFKSRAKRNKQIAQEWANVAGNTTKQCEKLYDSKKKINECKNSKNELVKINANVQKLIKDVRKNITRLEEYSDFPMELYDYMHTVDRFLFEVVCVIEEFMGSITGWLNTNADRFEKLVDAIITIISIIETWQVLIDFSVNWQSECGQCKKDGYDMYSCQLSLLCIDLPILPIPPFNLPDIYVDLSNINLGMDVTLPTFRFEPIRIPSIQLPDIPRPPKFELDIPIPDIPILPKVPKLPKIPSFIPTLKFDLPPFLPPAPKIPRIMPQIKGVINIGEFIGYIYCIIKSGIGLVAEHNVKTRIEQLTQRTSKVQPFDSFKLTIPQPPLEKTEIRVEPYANLQFNFDGFYNILNDLAKNINKKTNKLTKNFSVGINRSNANTSVNETKAQQSVEDSEEKGQGKVEGLEDKFKLDINSNENDNSDSVPDENLQSNLNINKSKDSLDKYKKLKKNIRKINSKLSSTKNLSKYKNNNNNKLIEREKAQTELINGLKKLKQEDNLYKNKSNRKEKINEIITDLKTDDLSDPNTDELNNALSKAKSIINGKRNKYQDLAETIKNDYDKFLEKISSDRLTSHKKIDKNISVNLFDVNKNIKEKIKNQPHPIKSYIEANETFIDGFKNKLSNKGPEHFNMSDSQYRKVSGYVKNINGKIEKVKPYFDSGKETTKDELIASSHNIGDDSGNTTPDSKNSSSNSMSNINTSVSIAQYVKGLYVDAGDNTNKSVFNYYEKGDKIQSKDNYFKEDINNDSDEDLIWWDENNVFIKYANQSDSINKDKNGNTVQTIQNYEETYEIVLSNDPGNIEDKLNENGYYKTNGELFKVYDNHSKLANFERNGNSFENISLSWDKAKEEDIGGYILKYNQRVDNFFENNRLIGSFPADLLEEKYILVLPNDINLEDAGFKIDGKFGEDSIKNHRLFGNIDKVIQKDLSNKNISISLNNLDIKWHYIKAAKLQKTGPGDNVVFKKSGPWTKQEVMGTDIWADKESPSLTLQLVDGNTGKVIKEGRKFDLNALHNYNLNVKRDDNIKVIKNWYKGEGLYGTKLSDNEENPEFESKNSFNMVEGTGMSINNINFDNTGTFEYKFGAKDPAGNIIEEKITLNVSGPDISIKGIEKTSSSAVIKVQTDSKITSGKIGFESNRNGFWNVLTGFNNNTNEKVSLFDVGGGSEFNLGEFQLSKNILFKTMDNKTIGKMNVDNANISLQNGYDSGIEFSDGYPRVYIKNSDTILFKIDISSKSIESINVQNGNYEKKEYENGYYIKNKNEPVFWINNKGDMKVAKGYKYRLKGEYEYDDGEVKYIIKDTSGNILFDIQFVAESFR